MKKKELAPHVSVTLDLAMPPISMSCDATMSMLMTYFPTQTKKLLTRAINRARKERRLKMGESYQAEFTAAPVPKGINQPC